MQTTVLEVDPDAPAAAAIEAAAAVLRRGGLVALPTETVYGLGANALDRDAVGRIFAAKERPATDPLIVHVADVSQVSTVAREMSAVARALAERFWPGPLTLILPKQAAVPGEVTAGLDTVAVRVPAHPVMRAVLAACGCPIAAPSANRFSRPSPTRAAHVRTDLDGRVDLILDAGPTPVGVESTIVDLTASPALVRRPGGVPVEALREVLADIAVATPAEADVSVGQVAPGQLLKHYAPAAPLTLYQGARDAVIRRVAADARTHAAAGERVAILAPEEDLIELAPLIAAQAAGGHVITQPVGARRDQARAARELFDAVRTVDLPRVDRILATAPDDTGLGRAILDRLRRAAEGRVISV
ncbi:MAG: L-threonylcarbamoyladenylate synthase [Vicinamibacterales bacterium]